MRVTLKAALMICGGLALAACEREVILTGQRLDPMAVASPDGPAVVGAPVAASTALALPAARMAGEWSHRGANAQHMPGHVALAGAGNRLLWSAPIGAGDGRRHRITADPIVAGGLVFTLDAQARVTATALNGAQAWSVDLTPPGESRGSVSGGGLAYEGGRVFASIGYGQLVAIDAATGRIAWRQKSAPRRAAARRCRAAWSMPPTAMPWAGRLTRPMAGCCGRQRARPAPAG